MIRLNLSVFWLLVSFPCLGHADTAMEIAYGKWVKISPADVLKPSPDYVPPRSSAGSVTNEYKRKPEGQVVVHSFQNPVPAPFVKPASK